MKTSKHKELAILLVGSLAVASPVFASNGADDNSSGGSSVSSSGSSSCSSGSSGSSGKCKRAYTVNSVISSTGAGLETAFTCTNLDKSKNAILDIEIFGADGTLLNTNAAGNGKVDIAPGQTETLTTGDIAAITGETVITLSGPVDPPGAASIGSTSPKVFCSAYLMADTGNPPAALMPLTMIKGTVHKGD